MINAALIVMPPNTAVFAIEPDYLGDFLRGATIARGIGVVSYECPRGMTHHAIAINFQLNWAWIGAPVMPCDNIEQAFALLESKHEVSQ